VEVLFGDGDAGKLFFKNGLDFRAGIEPGEQAITGLAVLQALIEFFAKCEGQAGDFSVAAHGVVPFRMVILFFIMGEEYSGWG
jgi:hypothetical protein